MKDSGRRFCLKPSSIEWKLSTKLDRKGSPWKLVNPELHPGRLTWNLTMYPWKRKIIFQTIIFRFYLNLPGCTWHQMTLGFPNCAPTLVRSRANLPVETLWADRIAGQSVSRRIFAKQKKRNGFEDWSGFKIHEILKYVSITCCNQNASCSIFKQGDLKFQT